MNNKHDIVILPTETEDLYFTQWLNLNQKNSNLAQFHKADFWDWKP